MKSNFINFNKYFYNREVRVKKKRKTLLQEQQKIKNEEKVTEKTQTKSSVTESDEDSKDTTSNMDDESQTDATESKVGIKKICSQFYTSNMCSFNINI